MAEKVVEKSSTTNTIKERATSKVGPLPVWAWGVILGVGGYLWYRHRQKAAAADVVTTDDSTQSVGAVYDGDENQPENPPPNPPPTYGQPVLPNPTTHQTRPVITPTGTISKVGRKPSEPINYKKKKTVYKGRPVYRKPAAESPTPGRRPIHKPKKASAKAHTPERPKETVDTRATVHGANYYPGSNNY